MDGLLKKHGIKNLGGWTVGSEHLTISVMEAPSDEPIDKLGMEPEVLALGAFETMEIKSAFKAEVAQMLKQAK